MNRSLDAIDRVVDFPMGHLRVLGPPGSGKTRALIERFRVLRAKNLDVFVLTFTKESHRRITESILDKNSVEFGADPVIQYSRLADEILALSGKKRAALLNDVEERVLLESVIGKRRSSMASGLRAICGTDRFVRDALDVIHALLQYGIESDRAERLAIAGSAPPDIADVLKLYVDFRGALSKENLTTQTGVCWEAVRSCKKRIPPNHPITRAAAILVEDFQDIDPGQFELLSMVAPPDGAVSVNVFGDPMGPVFGNRGTNDRFLLREFPERYGAETVRLNALSRDTDAEGKVLEALLAENLGSDADYHLPVLEIGQAVETSVRDRIDPDFTLEVVDDELDEAYAVGARIEQLLTDGLCLPEDIAVITNEKHRYAPVLQSAFRQHGIPLDTGGVAGGVFDDFLHSWLLLLETPDDVLAARSITTSPFFEHLRRRIVGDRPDAPADTRTDDELLREFSVALAAEMRRRKTSDWMRFFVEKCLRQVLVCFQEDSSDVTALAAVGRLLDSWSAYAAAVERFARPPDLRAFAGLSGIVSTRTGPPRRLPGFVGLYSCRESKGLSFPVVFLVGCSDLLFPSVTRRQNIIAVDHLERHIDDKDLSIYSARPAADALREQYHFLYIALSRSLGALHVTAPRNFGGEDYPAPCAPLDKNIAKRYWLTTMHEDTLPPPIRFAREWTAAPAAGALEERLAELSPAGAGWNAVKASPVPVKATRFPLSKSSLETYIACPRKFFYRKLLGIPQEPGEAAQVGTLLHAVMARLANRGRTKSELHAGATSAVVDELIDEIVSAETAVEPSTFFDRSIRHYLGRMVRGILDVDASLDESYTVADVEELVPFSYRGWKFTGRVDRVEIQASGGKRIVDFKSGEVKKQGKTHRRYVLKALDDPGKADWQIPFYVWALTIRDGQPPAAFRYMTAKAGEDPFAVTLYTCSDEANIPEAAVRSTRESYICENELEEIMERAAAIADEIFTPKAHYERTEDDDPCGLCEFSELCQREKKWS